MIHRTIASSPTAESDSFNLTIRRLANGRVTSLLFAVAQACLAAHRSFPPIALPLLGTAGSFLLPPPGTRIIAIAGGIGITPFLSFLHSIVASDAETWDVKLVVATREVGIMFELVRGAVGEMEGGTTRLNLDLHFFNANESSSPPPPPTIGRANVQVTSTVHSERLSSKYWEGAGVEEGRYYLCGPKGFEASVLEGLSENGIDQSRVVRESFAF